MRPQEGSRAGATADAGDNSVEEPDQGQLSRLEERSGDVGQTGNNDSPDHSAAADGGLPPSEEEPPEAEAAGKQRRIDEIFAEKRQVPPVRLGILVLLTAGSSQFPLKLFTWLALTKMLGLY